MTKETDKAMHAREDREDKAAQAVQEKQDAKDEASERAIQDKEDRETAKNQVVFGINPPTLMHGGLSAPPGPDALPVDRPDAAPTGPAATEDRIARACHDASRALGQVFGEDPGTAPQLAWDDAPQSERDRVAADVKLALAKPDAPTPDQHQVWFDDKLANKWQRGPAIDVDGKAHPHLVPFAELRAEARAKVMVCAAIVRALR
jgi:RyR domain